MLWRRTHCTGCCTVVQHASVRITAIQLDSLHFFFRLGKVKIISHIAGSWHEDCSRSLWVWCHRQTLMDSVPLVLNSFNPRQLLTVQYYWSRINTVLLWAREINTLCLAFSGDGIHWKNEVMLLPVFLAYRYHFLQRCSIRCQDRPIISERRCSCLECLEWHIHTALIVDWLQLSPYSFWTWKDLSTPFV